MMSEEIRTIRFMRNGYFVEKEVKVNVREGCGGWIKSTTSKTFYGTTTGYLSNDGKTIRKYGHGEILCLDVTGLEDICANNTWRKKYVDAEKRGELVVID
jgi:hypothetical protein